MQVRRQSALLIAAMLAMLLAAGCGGEKAKAPELPTTPVLGDGTIRGTVRFIGEPPEMPLIDNQPCHDEAEPIREETIVVGSERGLKNVLVYLTGAPRFSGAGNDPAVLDQKSCRYVPHVIAVQVGQTLRIRSSDPTMHNVHYNPDHNPPANFGMTTRGAEKDVTFDQQDIFRVKCDVHPWMTAYIGVFDNPFFAVTGDDGAFALKQVPPGRYTLVAWHERLGTQEKQVTVEDGKPLDVTFQYKAPE
jgi:plastocyanin